MNIHKFIYKYIMSKTMITITILPQSCTSIITDPKPSFLPSFPFFWTMDSTYLIFNQRLPNSKLMIIIMIYIQSFFIINGQLHLQAIKQHTLTHTPMVSLGCRSFAIQSLWPLTDCIELWLWVAASFLLSSFSSLNNIAAHSRTA